MHDTGCRVSSMSCQSPVCDISAARGIVSIHHAGMEEGHMAAAIL